MKERHVKRAKKRKGIEKQRVKPSIQSQASVALIGNEEEKGKQKEEQKK